MFYSTLLAAAWGFALGDQVTRYVLTLILSVVAHTQSTCEDVRLLDLVWALDRLENFKSRKIELNLNESNK